MQKIGHQELVLSAISRDGSEMASKYTGKTQWGDNRGKETWFVSFASNANANANYSKCSIKRRGAS